MFLKGKDIVENTRVKKYSKIPQIYSNLIQNHLISFFTSLVSSSDSGVFFSTTLVLLLRHFIASVQVHLTSASFKFHITYSLFLGTLII